MCERCDETAVRVARTLGMDPSMVRRVRDAIVDDMREADESERADNEDALSAVLGTRVRPVLLGTDPYVLITVHDIQNVGEDVHATVGVEAGGGMPEDHVGQMIRDAADAWTLRGTGGVTAAGHLIEGIGERP